MRDAVKRLGGAELAGELELGAPSMDRLPPSSPDLSGPRRVRRTAQRVQNAQSRRRDASYLAKLGREHAKQNAWLDRHRERMAARRGAEDQPPPGWSRELWRDCQDVMHDVTGKAARIHLSRLRYPAWSAMIRRAALGELGGECSRDWSSERARAVTCVGLALCRSAQRTRRTGKYTFVLRGFTRGAFAALVKGPRARAVHINTVAGVHRAGAAAHSGQLGYLPALAAAGLCYRQQLPAEQCESWERWVTRDGSIYAANRYWLVNPNPYDGHLDTDVRTRLLELAAAALSSDALTLRPRAPRASEASPAPPAKPEAPS